MTLKIEKAFIGHRTCLRLIGRLESKHLEELKAQIMGTGAGVVLDLENVTLVDADAIRFLGACESGGAEVLHCSRYVREWISKEREEGRHRS